MSELENAIVEEENEEISFLDCLKEEDKRLIISAIKAVLEYGTIQDEEKQDFVEKKVAEFTAYCEQVGVLNDDNDRLDARVLVEELLPACGRLMMRCSESSRKPFVDLVSED